MKIPFGSSRLTGDACTPTPTPTPNSMHDAYDTFALAKGTGSARIKEGGSSWCFPKAD